MSSSPSLAEFVGGFEKLDAKGKNWLIFEQQFTIAVKQKDVWNHYDGSTKRPVPADATKPTATETKEIEAWEKSENLALYLLLLKIPNNTYTRHKRKGTPDGRTSMGRDIS
ncbi:hypothetical protein C8Q76DRAFT_768719 [Earliella scabrosa]|nr:hypothetical protein C8Q76DRAFT_768719 [Earliella scabrosa]